MLNSKKIQSFLNNYVNIHFRSVQNRQYCRNLSLLKRIMSIYYRHTIADHLEHLLRRARERIFGLDRSVFAKTIQYYREVKGQNISVGMALSRALNKKEHKQAWFVRSRKTIDDIMNFYQEVEIYLFRQPYLKRFGGFKWYRYLVNHKSNPLILEYGCGTADLTEWLLKKYPNCKYTVADIPSKTLDFVKWKKNKYKYNYEILTIGKGKNGIPIKQNYDLIVCQNVLEHTINPLDIASAFIDHLANCGVLIIDFINAPGGENLDIAVKYREMVKSFLKHNFYVIKAIDEPYGNNGIYVKC